MCSYAARRPGRAFPCARSLFGKLSSLRPPRAAKQIESART